jgi:hypothetical protein
MMSAHDVTDPLPSPADGPISSQSSSPFFTRLPPEIRLQVYEEFWRLSGLRQEISPSSLGMPALKARNAEEVHVYGEKSARFVAFWARQARSPFLTVLRLASGCKPLLTNCYLLRLLGR